MELAPLLSGLLGVASGATVAQLAVVDPGAVGLRYDGTGALSTGGKSLTGKTAGAAGKRAAKHVKQADVGARRTLGVGGGSCRQCEDPGLKMKHTCGKAKSRSESNSKVDLSPVAKRQAR